MEDLVPETVRNSNELLHEMVVNQIRDAVNPHLQPYMEKVRSPQVLLGATLKFEVADHTSVAVTLSSLDDTQPTSFVLDSETRLHDNLRVQKTIAVHESSVDHPSYEGLVELNNARAIACILHNKQTRLHHLELPSSTTQNAASPLGKTALKN